ncbi:hypothetical protein AKJ16_DCAP21227 [Drosera capensis]
MGVSVRKLETADREPPKANPEVKERKKGKFLGISFLLYRNCFALPPLHSIPSSSFPGRHQHIRSSNFNTKFNNN